MDLTDDKGIIKFNNKQKMLVWLTMLIDRILRLLRNMKITISKKQIVNKKWIKMKRDNAKYNKDYYDYLEKNIHKYGFNNEKEFEEAMIKARDDCLESGGKLAYSSKSWNHRSMLNRYQKKWYNERNDGGIDPIVDLV